MTKPQTIDIILQLSVKKETTTIKIDSKVFPSKINCQSGFKLMSLNNSIFLEKSMSGPARAGSVM